MTLNRSLPFLIILIPVLPAAPIPTYGVHHDPIQILSGTVTVPTRATSSGLASYANLITQTGTLSGYSAAWVNFPGDLLIGTAASSFTVDPSLNWGYGDASMVIVHNGNSYGFEPRAMGNSPSNMWPGVFQTPTITLTSTGPLTFVLPFSVTILMEQNTQFSGSTAQFFEFRGAGTAALTFYRTIRPGQPDQYEYGLAAATLTFTSIPEPQSATLIFAGIASIIGWKLKRIRQ